mgnify:CR=1 FL=1
MDMDASPIEKTHLLRAVVFIFAIVVLIFGLVFFWKEYVRGQQADPQTDAASHFSSGTEGEIQETPEPAESYEILERGPVVPELGGQTSSTSVKLIRPRVGRSRWKSQDLLPAEGELSVRVPVLMYHHIRPMAASRDARSRMFTISPEAFEAQMIGLVRTGFRSITPDDLLDAMEGRMTLPEKPILITFDDSYRDQFVYGYPVLKRLGLQATFFVVTQSYRQGGAMTQEMIRELDQSGVGFIASHTQRHAYLPRYRKEHRLREIMDSKKDLEGLLGHSVTVFGYPYGGPTAEVEQEVKDAGYKMAFDARLGSLHSTSHAFHLRRIGVFEMEDVAAVAEAFSE